jgi:hypothetical protein
MKLCIILTISPIISAGFTGGSIQDDKQDMTKKVSGRNNGHGTTFGRYADMQFPAGERNT